MVLRIFYFLIISLISIFSFGQDCYILKYGKSKIQEKFINELKKTKNSFCISYKEIELTGNEITDKENLKEIKEGILLCLGETSAKYCQNLKNLEVLGFFISREVDFSKHFKVISFYPKLENFLDAIKDINFKKLIILYSQDTSERSMHIMLKGKEKNITIEPIKIEKEIDVTLKLEKALKDFDGIIIPIDKTYFDKNLINMVVELTHRENKKVLTFLELFLDYGVDYAFVIESKDLIKEAFDLILKKEKKGLFEVSSFVLKEGGKK